MKWWPKPRVRKNDVVDAEKRLDEARELAAKSRASSARLNRTLAANGFTELFTQALRRAQ